MKSGSRLNTYADVLVWPKAARSEATHMAQMAYEVSGIKDMLFLRFIHNGTLSIKQQLKNNGDNLKLLSN